MNSSIEKRLIYYTRTEELANALTHGLGVLLGLAGLTVLLIHANLTGDPWRIVSVTIYAGVFTIYYLISTLYHSIQGPRLRYLLRILDHAGIYMVIAATYTPFTLVSLHGEWGWSLFGTVWGLAVGGVILKTFMIDRLRILAMLLYIGMGWIAVVAFKPLLAALTPAGMEWLVAGGIIYTVGIIFYACNWIPYNHAIWHVFVLAGSICHFCSVLWYVVPLR